jgi:hypothetical protein
MRLGTLIRLMERANVSLRFTRRISGVSFKDAHESTARIAPLDSVTSELYQASSVTKTVLSIRMIGFTKNINSVEVLSIYI